MSEWISIEESQPTECKVLATDGIDIEVMYYWGTYKGGHDWSSLRGITLDVTHWMTLPNLPIVDINS